MSQGAKTLYLMERRKPRKKERMNLISLFPSEKIPESYMNQKNARKSFWRYFCFHRFFHFDQFFSLECRVPALIRHFISPLCINFGRETNYPLSLSIQVNVFRCVFLCMNVNICTLILYICTSITFICTAMVHIFTAIYYFRASENTKVSKYCCACFL